MAAKKPQSLKSKREPKPRKGQLIGIDKSTLSVPTADRKRDAHHLKFIRTLPCTICRCAGSHAHHLMHAQPKARGLKAGDQFTVPLCPEHHQNGPDALHKAGNEREWWDGYGIDAIALALQLWSITHPD